MVAHRERTREGGRVLGLGEIIGLLVLFENCVHIFILF